MQRLIIISFIFLFMGQVAQSVEQRNASFVEKTTAKYLIRVP